MLPHLSMDCILDSTFLLFLQYILRIFNSILINDIGSAIDGIMIHIIGYTITIRIILFNNNITGDSKIINAYVLIVINVSINICNN